MGDLVGEFSDNLELSENEEECSAIMKVERRRLKPPVLEG